MLQNQNKASMKTKFVSLLILIFLFTTCKKDHMLDCFKNAGNTVTESRTASPFVNIDLNDNVDLVLNPNAAFYINVTAGENLVNGIITEIDGNTLYIRNENRCNWMRSFKNTYTVEVGMDKPVTITYYGSGDINCKDTIRSDEFTFDVRNGSGSINFLFNCPKIHLNNHTGRADIHAKGFSATSYIYLNDVGTLDAEALNTYNSYITNNSTGDCKVRVSEDLGVLMYYIGNIYYTGNPHTISKEITGEGKLIAF